MIAKILSFFGGLKITALLGGALAIAFGWIKILGYQNKELKEKVAADEKEDEIIEDIGLAEVQNEVKQNEALKDNDGANWRDSI